MKRLQSMVLRSQPQQEELIKTVQFLEHVRSHLTLIASVLLPEAQALQSTCAWRSIKRAACSDAHLSECLLRCGVQSVQSRRPPRSTVTRIHAGGSVRGEAGAGDRGDVCVQNRSWS